MSYVLYDSGKYFYIINILSAINKNLNKNSDFLTTILVFNMTSNKVLYNYFILLCIHYYKDDEYISNKIAS